jgi:ribulose bisphosphate carboxylase small subunit
MFHFFPENCAIYEIMSKNVVEPEMPQMAVWQHIACWISKAIRAQALAHAHACAHTHTQKYIRLNFFLMATVVS